ncbi:Asp-tRNA(Asn)/Glu-tRNA(Gln) amidotransferase subunit GatA [Sediminivirga luteola]|uniref:Glutamyl-tRNA(Gln) amidotransferase subunit A n=1 Tax=Sediminivirga luteola TaxID=1774748 RepID=A0A8J2TXI3_9MICO|nr:Asp-tRNA(Asn)/Glu-tRNA(Gln) amidotransferase subunit GatA [Sediminivirga luteola]GGA12677.1 glutamyl-tRNA(Gln) amidotransferase subunit A [Sediminivirga luteola]
MGEITRLTAAELASRLSSGEVSSVEAVQAHLDQIERAEPLVNSFITVTADDALATARQIDERRARGEELHPLAGVPVAVKDLIVTKGTRTTAGSKMLQEWVPPYDATVTAKVREAGLPILGKTNMDEFAMGSTTEHSAFGRTYNPWHTGRVPGGSSGGSAAAVAAWEAPLAIGTDTGGSIRQPAALTGTVGVKPTYGSVSRYGVIAMASSLDQVGPMTRTVADAAALHELLAGHDAQDSTSLPQAVPGFRAAAANRDVKGLKVGVLAQSYGAGVSAGVRGSFQAALDLLAEAGAEIVELQLPALDYALDAYYLIMPSEVSSNLARFDGMRYGLRAEPQDGPVTAERVMAETRRQGFGWEAKRRIILGTYALSAGYYDAYYGSAQKVRTLVKRDFARAFEQVDVLASPTAPTTAFGFGQDAEDPMTMYLNDVFTIPANLAGLPGLSLPSGIAGDGLPVGFQLLAPELADERLYSAGGALEALLEERRGGRFADQLTEIGMAGSAADSTGGI